MYTLLLALIYLAFISLGLPDSLLGSGWPVLHSELQIPVSYAGIISMIITGGTIISSLMSDRLTRRFSTGLITAVSVFLTALGLFGFSVSGSFWQLCLWGIPYGLGAGAIDAALNNYVALHYNSRHMSWLHCFWGVGASISPYIMSYCLTANLGWRQGYRSVSIIQIILTVILFLSLPLRNIHKKNTASTPDNTPSASTTESPVLGLRGALKIRGVKYVLLAFFGYCALETTAGLWASSYFVLEKGIEASIAARYASLFYLGITLGRFLCGFVADKIGDRGMIRLGLGIIFLGVVILWLPSGINLTAFVGLLIIGLGCAPIYPSIIHSTPANFGAENSQSIIGIQMASAYVGSTFMPPVFGLIANHISIGLYPVYMMIFVVLMVVMMEKLNKRIVK